MQDATTAAAVKYFFGRISRDEAEEALEAAGIREGLFLLRESITTAGNYVLSICHQGSIHHYSMERHGDQIMIPDGRPFAGPVELIHHHSRYLDGFVTKPTIACERPDGVAPLAWPGITMLELEFELLEEAKKRGMKKNKVLHNALGPQRQMFVSRVAKRLHLDQPWFHGEIERASAEQALNMSGHVDGKYLIRVKKKEDSYALSLSYRHETKHYKIDQPKSRDGVRFAIERGPPFDNLMDLVAHYHNRMDGLLCKLTEPCVRRHYRPKNRTLPDLIPNPTYGTAVNPTFGGEVADTGIAPEFFDESLLDEPEPPEPPEPSPPQDSYYLVASAEMEKVYDYVRAQNKKSEMEQLKRESIELLSQIGAGNFGAVFRGRYKFQAKNKTVQQVDVAVKVLKCGDSPTAAKDMLAEASLMAKLQHRHIVGMVGICPGDSIMLVLELAKLGPLNKYLKKNRLPMKALAGLMHQVALGMAYLESMKFVHRDLAARNVLLASEQHAKISDFGMSRALGMDNNYYKAAGAGKWPIKWYAPECIYFHKFDSKSDVWSYGIALWEATSYGDKPYKGFRGSELIDLIAEQGKRLDKPPDCSDNLYAVMQHCWQRLPQDRPTFKELVVTMSKTI